MMTNAQAALIAAASMTPRLFSNESQVEAAASRLKVWLDKQDTAARSFPLPNPAATNEGAPDDQ